MFTNIEQHILQLLTASAYDPFAFYGIIILVMTVATFGLPISEELVIISAALATYMGAHPELYPPPLFAIENMHTPVRPSTTALVCFLSVFLSDMLVYMMGFIFREKITNHSFIKKVISKDRKEKINNWISKYGHFVLVILRFTPGLKFIGYLTCGVIRIPIYKFILISGGVALIVIPSQVFIIYLYGETIVKNLKILMVILAIILFTLIALMVISPIYKSIKQKETKL